MEIARDDFRPRAEECKHVAYGSLVEECPLEAVQVPEVLTDDDLPVHRKGDGALQLSSEGEDRGCRFRETQPERRETACAPEHREALRIEPDDRVVHRADDRSVMDEEDVGDTSQALESLGRVDAHRLIGEIAARADEGARGALDEQAVEWCGGQHRADARIAGCNQWGEVRAAARQQEDRRLVGREDALFREREDAVPSHLCRRGKEHGERFRLASLPCPKAAHGFAASRVHEELKATEALERKNLPAHDACHRARERLVASRQSNAAFGKELERRTARGTRDGLSVEATIVRIVVLCLACRAHREGLHRRTRPVVGKGLDDREPRPAGGAVREGVAKSARARRRDLVGARRAHGEIRGQHGPHRSVRRACDDAKVELGSLVDFSDCDARDAGGRRAPRLEIFQESVKSSAFPLRFDA